MKSMFKVTALVVFAMLSGFPAMAENAPALRDKAIIQEPTPIEAEKPDPSQLFASINARKYTLGPNDVVNVNVLGIDEFSKDAVRVQPDGKINLTGIGSVYTSGLTLDALSTLLEQKYAHYAKNPRVIVSLEKSRPFIVQVTGAVTSPGSYEINTDTESYSSFYDEDNTYVARKTPILSNILNAAGGIKYDADVEHVVITNTLEGTEYEVNMLELLENGKTDQDIYLMAGDTVHVPALDSPLAVDTEKYEKYRNATFTERIIPIRVIGYVNNPGLLELRAGLSATLNTAIAEAGGYLGDAPYPPKKVFLSRYSTGGKLVTTVVNPMEKDLTLMPNDVLYVPEKTRPLVGRGFDYLMRVLDPVSSVASGYNHWSLMFDPQRFND